MSMPIWICILLSEAIVLVGCAPKLGHALFDPLSYEAEKFQRVRALINQLIPTAQTPENESTIPQTSPVLATRRLMEEKITKNPLTTARRCLLTNKTDNVVTIADIFKMNENSDRETTKQPKLSRSLRYGDFLDLDHKESCAEYDYDKNDCKVINNRILCGYDKNIGVSVDDEVINLGNNCRLRNGRIECGYLEPPYKNSRRPPANDDEGKSVQLRARDSLTLDGDNCSDCSSKNPNEASLYETGTLFREATIPYSKLALKSNSLDWETTDSLPEQGTPQESNDSSAEFMTPIPQAIESNTKLVTNIDPLPELVSSNPVSIQTSIPVAIDFSPIKVRYRTLPKLAIASPRTIEASEVKLAPSVSEGKIITETDLLSKLGKPSVAKETKKSYPVPDLMNTTQRTPEFLSKINETTQKTAKPSLTIIDKTPEFEISANIQDLETAPAQNLALNNTFVRALRSADSTPETAEMQPTVTRRTRWCVEKGDRIVCYYSQNY